VELTIARDGTLLGAEFNRRSGLAAFDVSIEELFRRERRLRPLPDEFKKPQLVLVARFELDNNASL